MTKTELSLKWIPRARSEAGRNVIKTRARVNFETLEGRALLSTVHAHIGVNPPTPYVHVPRFPHPGPILNEVVVGGAVKSPRFYPFFTGTKRAELNAAGARAYLNGPDTLVLTGIVAGKILGPGDVTKDDQSEFYVWGIDRGLTHGPGPFPARPGIKFDAVVAVGITPQGISGYALDLTNNTFVPLTTDDITLEGFDLKVNVPTAPFLPAGATLNYVPRVTFWTQTTAPPGAISDIASFAPEFTSFPIAASPHSHRLPLLDGPAGLI